MKGRLFTDEVKKERNLQRLSKLLNDIRLTILGHRGSGNITYTIYGSMIDLFMYFIFLVWFSSIYIMEVVHDMNSDLNLHLHGLRLLTLNQGLQVFT